MVVRNSEGRILASSGADVYVEDVAGSVSIEHTQAYVWARQLNPESRTVNVVNHGGTCWILGLKTENYGIKVDTLEGGRTEVIGAHIYTGFGAGDKQTLFRIEDAFASFAGIREITFSGTGYSNSVTEIRGTETRVLPRRKGWAAWTLYSGAKEKAR